MASLSHSSVVLRALAVILATLSAALAHHKDPYKRGDLATPSQVHLSLYNGTDTRSVTISWVTQGVVKKPQVEFGSATNLLQTFDATTMEFDNRERKFYTHSVTLTDLANDSVYFYGVGNDTSLSEMITINTPNLHNSTTYAVYGDLGFDDAHSFPQIKKDFDEGKFQMVLHVGDIAYDLGGHSSDRGDEFMGMIEHIAKRIPYQVAVGNHEADDDRTYLNYRKRFKLSDLSENMYYSFNSGLVHFLVVASEFYYDATLSNGLEDQYKFVKQDLALANLNRDARPWIVVLSHRNFYCSNTPDPGFDTCSEEFSPMRDGINNGSKFNYGLENLFHKFGVDFFFAGHKHSYERFYPAFQGKMYGPKSDTYLDPEAVVMVTQGNAGCRNGLGHFLKPNTGWLPFSAVRISEYGYSQFTVLNSTTATVKMISEKGRILDSFTVVKSNPRPRRRG